MGDGSKKANGLKINTHSFSLQEVVMLINVLIIRYQLDCTIINVKNGQYKIYIQPNSMDKLRNIVLPFIIPSMLYKIK
jgi:LAGLIDADG DNA endonuclease family